MIQNLREQKPTFASVEREARDTDRVTVDFNGTIDGQPFEGGSGENIPIVLGAGRMLADFEAGLLGARAGEQRTIKLTFPQNYGAPALAGKKAEFAVTVKSVEERHLPELDDEFCKAYGVEQGGIEQLRTRSAREHAARAGRCDPRAAEEAGAGRPRRGESDRAAEVDGRCAGARSADRCGAPHGCARRFADSAARCVPGRRASSRAAEPAGRRNHQDREHPGRTSRRCRRASRSSRSSTRMQRRPWSSTAATRRCAGRWKRPCWKIRWSTGCWNALA